MPTVVAVGLGPAGAEYLTPRVRDLIESASTARLRTRRHPAAAAFPLVESFDGRYERADDFDSLYAGIVDELVGLARADPSGTVVYAVPGSPLIAERTVELLRAREDVDLVVEPALSFVDLACARLGIDPVSVGLRLGDALALPERLGGGPLLLAQAHAPSVLADIALRVDAELAAGEVHAVVLHHLGLDDEVVHAGAVGELGTFAAADHLTSVYLPTVRSGGDAVEELVLLMDELRARCPWDEIQTHASLGRYLLEESYECLDALEVLAGALEDEPSGAEGAAAAVELAGAHAREELGDVLFQVVFHAKLGSEEGLFDLRAIADEVRHKLVARHPHVFGDAVAATPDAVAARWEELKREEKGRESVLDGIPDALPALSLMAKVRRKGLAVGVGVPDRATLVAAARRALDSLPDPASLPDDGSVGADATATTSIGEALAAVCDLARLVGVDPEQALRARVRTLAAQVRAVEAADRYQVGGDAPSSVVASEVDRSDKE